MLPKLFQEAKPVPRHAEESIGELVSFTRESIPRQIWIEEFGQDAPRTVRERHEHHYHLHYHDYRRLTKHVHKVVEWENEWPVVYWPCPVSCVVVAYFVGLMLLAWAVLEILILADVDAVFRERPQSSKVIEKQTLRDDIVDRRERLIRGSKNRFAKSSNPAFDCGRAPASSRVSHQPLRLRLRWAAGNPRAIARSCVVCKDRVVSRWVSIEEQSKQRSRCLGFCRACYLDQVAL